MSRIKILMTAFVIMAATFTAFSQNGPGKIIRAATGTGATILDGNSDGYVSAGTSGYTDKNDTTSAANEYYYRPLTPYGGEPCCDLRRGPDHRFTDFVPDSKNNGVYMRFATVSTVDYVVFRMRMGSVIPGAKGFSILVDTDLKYGGNGTNADPNYVAKTTGINGNPGFELEIVLETGFRVAIYRVDGLGNPSDNIPTSHAVYTNTAWQDMSQISLAATNENGDPDYFLDWYVPYSAITGITSTNSVTVPSGTAFVTGTSHQMRFIPTTVMAPKPSIAGPVSDMYPDSTSIVWQAPTCMSGCVPFGTICTAAPAITGAIAGSGTGSVTVSWTRSIASTASSATIQLYKNGSVLGSTFSVNNGATGTLSSLTIASGDLITATAISSNEQTSSFCFASNTIPARGICASPPSTEGAFCAHRKGFQGTAYPGSSAKIRITKLSYAASGDGETEVVNLVPGGTSGLGLMFASGATWNYDGNCTTGNGTNAAGTYMVEFETTGGCRSKPAFSCVNHPGNTTTQTAIPTITNSTAIYTNTTTISGTCASGAMVRIFYDGYYYGRATVTTTNWTYTFTTALAATKVIQVSAQLSTDGCMSDFASATVLCQVNSPSIDIDETTSKITSGLAITGRSSYPGGEVKVYNQSGDVLIATVTADSDGNWTTGATTAVAGTTYYATITSSSCTSARATTQTTTTSGEMTPSTYCGGIIQQSNGGAFTTVNGGSVLRSDATQLQGTLNTTAPVSSKINVYVNGGVVGSYVLPSATTSWGPVNVSGYLFNGATVTVAVIESGTKGEYICASQTVTCACAISSTPPSPVINGTSTTSIFAGNSAVIKVDDPVANYFYSVASQETGAALSKGIWYSSGNATVTGRVFGPGDQITFNTTPVASTTTAVVSSTFVNGTEECTSSSTRTLTVLPVSLTEFKAYKNNKAVVLSWTTSIEIDFSHFEIERSADGISFTKIGSKAGTGLLSGPNYYSFTDNTPLTGNNFYRLKMMDLDGKFEHSKVLLIRNSGAAIVVNSVRPNPFVSEISISAVFAEKAEVSVLLTDAAGRTLQTQAFSGSIGLNEIKIEDLRPLPAGTYFVNIVSGQEVFRYKVLKITQQ